MKIVAKVREFREVEVDLTKDQVESILRLAVVSKVGETCLARGEVVWKVGGGVIVRHKSNVGDVPPDRAAPNWPALNDEMRKHLQDREIKLYQGMDWGILRDADLFDLAMRGNGTEDIAVMMDVSPDFVRARFGTLTGRKGNAVVYPRAEVHEALQALVGSGDK